MQKLQNRQSNNKGVSVSQTSFYSGKLPSPEMMQQYNAVEPNFANRILTILILSVIPFVLFHIDSL